MGTLRLLFKRPAYALACITILALGIGANTAMFTVLYPVVLNPLPYPDAERLVLLYEKTPLMGEPFGNRMPVSRVNFEEWQKQTNLFEASAAFQQKDLKDDARPAQPPVPALFTSAQLIPMLGTRPQLGRLFTGSDDRKGAEPVALLTDDYFEIRFQRDPASIGQRISLGGTQYTIIGVLPPRFPLPALDEGDTQLHPRVLLPLAHLWSKPEEDTQMMLYAAARLRPGVSIERARAEMAPLVAGLFDKDPNRHQAREMSVYSFREENASPELRHTLYLLLGAVGFVLLIGCANLANLTLARAAGRSREIAMRRALGATRGAIISQLLRESFVVSLVGAGAGLLLAHGAVQAILAMEPPGLDRPDQIHVNLPVFLFTAAVSALTALLFGLAPAVAASRTSVNMALKTGGGGGASAARSRSRQLLIVAEVAMALLLVTGAGLTIRSFANVIRTGIGIDPERFLSADIQLPEDRYQDPASRVRFFDQWMEQVRAIPGVEAVTVADALPLHTVNASSFEIEGRPRPDPKSFITSDHANVSPEYFRVLRLPLLTGRDFEAADVDREPKERNGVVIVNQAFARQFFPNESPVGQHLVADGGKESWEIVGVSADYRALGAEEPVRPQRFYPSRSMPKGILIARTAGDPAALAAPLRGSLAAVDPQLVASAVETLKHYVDSFPEMVQRRFMTLLLGIFAAFALMLAMTGVYSVVANLVAARTREIGIRMALGATPGGIGGMVLAESLRPVVAGLALGLAGSWVLAQVLASRLNLFGVTAHDPLTMAMAVGVILLVSPAAVFVPLRRATRVSCTVALREE